MTQASAQYAEAYRSKLSVEGEVPLTAIDILTQPSNKEEWRRKAKEILETEEMKDCTFKPKTIGGGVKETRVINLLDQNQVILKSSGDKCEDLYKHARIQQTQEKVEKSTVDYEYERQQDQCTFKPQLQKKVQQKALPKGSSRGADAYMERMKKAREEKEQKRLILERGIPSQMKKKLPDKNMGLGKDGNKFYDTFDNMKKD